MADERKIFSLLDVTRSIQKTLEERYRSAFWVKAEMIKLNYYSHSGHCYPDLVEKRDGKVIAQLKAVLWKTDYLRIDRKFRQVLKEPLKDGVNILFQATITFDTHYGLSLNILDIDPAFSLGELEREKQETILKLNEEGIFSLNKSRSLPLLPQRIAVISVETSKGYADYLKMIEDNPNKFKFFNYLFPSLLQGDKSVQSIIAQLQKIKKVVRHFDAVAIIRGGGGDLGLSSYNNYSLAKEIAMFPIPVFTGIGHSTNETVCEMVAFRNAITPTELADFLLKKFEHFHLTVNRASDIITSRSRVFLEDHHARLDNVAKYFQAVTRNNILRHHGILGSCAQILSHGASMLIDRQKNLLAARSADVISGAKHYIAAQKTFVKQLSDTVGLAAVDCVRQHKRDLDAIDKTVRILDPSSVLRRGFSITLKNGKSVKHAAEVAEGDVVTTILASGTITSAVQKEKS